MIDRKTELDIKTLKSFLELWGKFHALYAAEVSKEVISGDDEKKLLDTKEVIGGKYQALKDSMEFKYVPHGRMTDPVSDVLRLEAIRFASEKNMHKMEGDWKDSYVFLNNILERLENKRRRLDGFNPVGVFFKRMTERT